MKKFILFFLLLASPAFAQWGSAVPYPTNLILKDDGTIVSGSGRTIDFTTGCTVSYASGVYTITCSGGGGGDSTLTVQSADTTVTTANTLDFRTGLIVDGSFPEANISVNPTLLGWTDDGTVVRLTTSTDTVGIGTASPITKLDVRGIGSIGSTENGGVKYLNGANSLNYGTVTGTGSLLSNSGEGSLVGGYLSGGNDLDNNGKASIASVYSLNGVNHLLGYSNGDLTVTLDSVVAGVTSSFDYEALANENGNNFRVI